MKENCVSEPVELIQFFQQLFLVNVKNKDWNTEYTKYMD